SALDVALTAVAEQGTALANVVVQALARLPLRPDVLPAMEVALRAFRALAGRGLAGRSRDDVVAHALRLGLPMAPVHRPEEFVGAEQTRARGFFRRTAFPHL